MAYKEEKKQHDRLLDLLKKHFNEDEIEEAIRELDDSEREDEEFMNSKDFMDEDQDIAEEGEEELPENELMEDEGEEEEDEEEMELPKDKRKGLAVVIIQKRMSKPKKDMY